MRFAYLTSHFPVLSPSSSKSLRSVFTRSHQNYHPGTADVFSAFLHPTGHLRSPALSLCSYVLCLLHLYLNLNHLTFNYHHLLKDFAEILCATSVDQLIH